MAFLFAGLEFSDHLRLSRRLTPTLESRKRKMSSEIYSFIWRLYQTVTLEQESVYAITFSSENHFNTFRKNKVDRYH